MRKKCKVCKKTTKHEIVFFQETRTSKSVSCQQFLRCEKCREITTENRETANPTIVLLQGAFDILNSGHVRAFRWAKSQGDYLIVAVNTPKLIADYKKRLAILPYHDKKLIIESIKWVDKVVPARDFSPQQLLEKYGVHVYMIAPEWLHTKANEIAYMKSKGCKIVMCHNYKRVIRSSDIRRMLVEQATGSAL